MLVEIIESLFEHLVGKILGNRAWAWVLFILLIITVGIIVIFV